MFLMHGRMFAEARSLEMDEGRGSRLRITARRRMGHVVIVDLLVFRIVVGLRPRDVAEREGAQRAAA